MNLIQLPSDMLTYTLVLHTNNFIALSRHFVYALYAIKHLCGVLDFIDISIFQLNFSIIQFYKVVFIYIFRLYAGPEVDIWSCGIILYALLCGSVSFQ